MKDIFAWDNPFPRLCDKLVKLIYLNLLWVIASLPVITIGASTAALYYTSMRLAHDGEGYLTRDFFHAFRENFRQGTVYFFLETAVIIVCMTDFMIMGKSTILTVRLTAFLILGFLLAFLLPAVYFFPLISQFENTTPGIFRAACGLAVRNIHWSICLLVLETLLPLLILYRFLPLIIFGAALPVFLQSLILNRIFEKLNEQA